MYIMVSVLIKMVFSIFGSIIKKLTAVVFLIDIYFTYMSILGLYFYLNQTDSYYSNTSQYVTINIFVLLVNSIVFFLSSFKESSSYPYNFLTGMIMMTISTALTL